MRDRLLKLLDEAINDESTSYSNIVDYLLENGVIVPLCKVGDTVYQPGYKFTKCSAHDYTPRWCDDSFCCGCVSDCDSVKKPYIHKGKVCKIEITKGQISVAVDFEEKFDSSSHIIGKTVFLTREEAEAKLKGEQ